MAAGREPAGSAPAGALPLGSWLSVQLVGADGGEDLLCAVAADLTEAGLGAADLEADGLGTDRSRAAGVRAAGPRAGAGYGAPT
jgi:hypothetical protein